MAEVNRGLIERPQKGGTWERTPVRAARRISFTISLYGVTDSFRTRQGGWLVRDVSPVHPRVG